MQKPLLFMFISKTFPWTCMRARCIILFCVIIMQHHVFRRWSVDNVLYDDAAEMGRHMMVWWGFQLLCLWMEFRHLVQCCQWRLQTFLAAFSVGSCQRAGLFLFACLDDHLLPKSSCFHAILLKSPPWFLYYQVYCLIKLTPWVLFCCGRSFVVINVFPLFPCNTWKINN